MPIRAADPQRDGPACARLYRPYVAETTISLEEAPPTAAEMTMRIQRTTTTHPWLVAEREGEVAGFAYAARHRERASYRWAADVSVYVGSDHHRHGLGGSLMRTLLTLIRSQGLHVACAGITLPNTASVALHESLGFRPVGVYRRIGYKHGAWVDVGWWQLALSPQEPTPPREPGPPVE